MSRKNKLIGTITVFIAMIASYQATISLVPDDVIAKWNLLKWISAGLLVALQGLITWKAVLINPNSVEPPRPQ